MAISNILAIDKHDKAQLWEIFHYEKLLDDNEERLSKELNLYEEQIRKIAHAKTEIEIELLTVYMKHVKNLRRLLLKLRNNRNEILQRLPEEL